jgi:hypothetical protein
LGLKGHVFEKEASGESEVGSRKGQTTCQQPDTHFRATPQDYHRALGIKLHYGARVGRFFMSEVHLSSTIRIVVPYHQVNGQKSRRAQNDNEPDTNSPQSGIKSLFSAPLICTGGRRNPATCGTKEGSRQLGFSATLRAGGGINDNPAEGN